MHHFFYTIKRLHFGNFSPKYFPVFPTYVPQPVCRPVKLPGCGPWPQPTQPKVALLIFSLRYAWCPNCLVRQFFIVVIISTHAVSKHFHVSDCQCQAPWPGRGSSCFGAVGPTACNFTTSCCAALSFLLSFFPLLSLACILLSSIHLQSIHNTTSKFISCITLTNSRLKFPLLFGCLFCDFTQKVTYIML